MAKDVTTAPEAIPPSHAESPFSIVNALSIVIVFGYIAWMPLWMFFPPTGLPPEVLAILNQMMGSWGYAFAAVIGFHIGSNKTNKDKDATIFAQAQTGPAEVAKQVAAAVATATSPTNGVAETQAWNEAVAANTPDAFNAYLAKFPTGVHAAEAKGRITALSNP